MPIDLNSPKILEAFKWRVNQAVLFDSLQIARQIILNLPEMLVATPVVSPEDQFTYQDILIKAKFIALPLLHEKEIVELIQNNFIQIFDLPDYDLWKKIKTKLITLSQFEDRDSFKKELKEALLKNEQVLTIENLILGGKSVKGTVKNWLTDYHQVLGTEKVEALKLYQYLVSGENTKKLSVQSKKNLDYLLKFYEKLKISSVKFEGIEESIIFNVDGELDFFAEGITEMIGRDAKEIVSQLEGMEAAAEIRNEIEARYRGNEEEIRKINEEKAKILESINGDFEKLASLLFKAITPRPGKIPNKVQVEAILEIFIDQGQLEDLLEEKKFNEMMVAFFREKGREIDLEGFKVNPRAPQYVSVFLQHILKDMVGLSEDESGKIGMRLFNLLMKKGKDSKYQGLVYFDLEKREFRWS
jgi:hypothetical protein